MNITYFIGNGYDINLGLKTGKRRYYMNLISDRCRMNMENESVRSRVFIGYKTDFFKF